jgi:hypothetical protein
MAERILELAVAIAPEHVRDRHRHLRAGFHRARDECIGIRYVEVDGDRRALERLGTGVIPSGMGLTLGMAISCG